jgi:tetratricopeptide (TPR) repeat protein
VSSRLNRYVSVSALALLAACHSTPHKASSVPAFAQAGMVNAPVASTTTGAGTSSTAKAPAVDTSPVPERAAQEYAQALQLMKSGRDTDAELEFKQLVVGYPQFAGPQLNLGLLYLHDSRFPEAEAAFRAALVLKPSSAITGNELGITLRKLGKFEEAEAAYQHAVAAEPDYAPAHLNLGILYDLYLAQPQKALDEYERYVAIVGENKQVAGWMVELRKRVGAPSQVPKKEPA